MESDPQLALDSLALNTRGALYVICRDRDLDEDNSLELRASLLSGRRGMERHVILLSPRLGNIRSDASALAVKARMLGSRQGPGVSRGPDPGLLPDLPAGSPFSIPKLVDDPRRPPNTDGYDDAVTVIRRAPTRPEPQIGRAHV